MNHSRAIASSFVLQRRRRVKSLTSLPFLSIPFSWRFRPFEKRCSAVDMAEIQ
jgi:hypothetical protein